MRTCDKLADLIALYASGDLEQRHRARVEQHLEQCTECRRAVAQMRALTTAASAECEAPPQDLADRIMRQVAARPVLAPRSSFRWLPAVGYAAGIAAVFGAGILVGLRLPGPAGRARIGPVAAAPPPAPGQLGTAVTAAPTAVPETPNLGRETAPPAAENVPPPTAPTLESSYAQHTLRARAGARHAVWHPTPSPTTPAESVPPGAGVLPATSDAVEPTELTPLSPIPAPQPTGLDDAQLAAAPPGDLEW